MGRVERKQRQKTEVRSAIHQAAWQMVKKEGWQALSIRKIADAIEYSIPVIYDHFENKEAILFEFAKEGFLLLSKKVEAARKKYTDPEEALEAMAKAYWSFAVNNEEYYQLMYGLGMPSCEVDGQNVGCVCYDQLMLETVREIIAAGSNPDMDYKLKFYTLWSFLHGLIAMNRMKNSPASKNMNQVILKDAINSFIRGLKG
ncbi:MAG: TetR/AcrR family transcriptional regulator [Puia sp.]|nr:TetR/AcrR family transcriptional regulator [Puia sp.]